ncbi:MAG: YaiO family outer membrane beta-barrel protein [Steroidobacteraceae bacterium]
MLALLAAPPALACDAALQATVAARPGDTDARDVLARSCAKAGSYEDALRHYDLLLARDASNVDWIVGKSQALLALDRPREALPLLERARTLAPAYEDIWRLNATALAALDRFDAADALLAEAAARFPASAWPRERREALAERRLLERGTRLSADLSYEDLSGGRPAWKGASLGFDHRLGGSRHLFSGLHLEERFDTRDEQILVGFADRLNEDWSYGLSADAAPDAEILPEWSVSLEAGRALPDDWSLGLRYRHASHSTADVDTLSTSVEKYLGAYSLGYSLNTAKVSDISDPHFGHLLRLNRDYGDANRIALVVGFGEEAETVAPGVVQVTDTRSVSLNGVHWSRTAWGLSWEAGWYEQGDLYDRFRIRLGLEHRF